MATLIDSYRRVIFAGQAPDWPYLTLAAVVSLLLLILGYRYFKRAEAQFVDLT